MTGTSRFTVAPVVQASDINSVRTLFRAYVDWLEIDLSYQGFEEELAGLPGNYAPPGGALLAAKTEDGRVLGCVGLRPFGSSGSCEMKRLYVAPDGRGLGIGAALVAEILNLAQAGGYSEMLLDTLPHMSGAIRLYKAAGFTEIPAYYETPVSETIFFRKALLDV